MSEMNPTNHANWEVAVLPRLRFRLDKTEIAEVAPAAEIRTNSVHFNDTFNLYVNLSVGYDHVVVSESEGSLRNGKEDTRRLNVITGILSPLLWRHKGENFYFDFDPFNVGAAVIDKNADGFTIGAGFTFGYITENKWGVGIGGTGYFVMIPSTSASYKNFSTNLRLSKGF